MVKPPLVTAPLKKSALVPLLFTVSATVFPPRSTLPVKVKFDPPLIVQEAPLNSNVFAIVRDRLRGEKAQPL